MKASPPHKDALKRVGIWIRVSTEDQAKGDSPEHHEKRARNYADAKGWIVKEVYDLSGVSGKTVMEHSETQRMLKDLQCGHITALVFSKLERLARNTRELLDFADVFNKAGADMVSLQESIDTSTPAGRLFFTVMAALAQFGREEIAERVKASIKVRAELGKSLGGAAPFGYQWKDNKLIPNLTEAPIRKRMYELFAEHKRKKSVARMLNEAGYRTRKGAKFTDTTVVRLIEDTTAKGQYRANHTYRNSQGKLLLKPESEWIFTPVEPIISEELWNRCNAILDSRHEKKVLGPKPVHLFAGLLWCGCGQKMYVFSRTPKYICSKCRNKIPMEDIEAIFRDQLKSYFVSRDRVREHLERGNETIRTKEEQVSAHRKQLLRTKAEMKKIYDLYLADQIATGSFGNLYKPLEEQERQLTEALPQMEAELDALKMDQISADVVATEAADLHDSWPSLGGHDKRKVIETITDKITVSKDEIDITFSYTPSYEELTKRQRNLPGS